MSSPPASPERAAVVQSRPEGDSYVGLVTRMISWGVDALLINLVAIITGLGVQLMVSLFPITKHLKPLFVVIGGAVYILWATVYFVGLWSMRGQTLGSRLMQVRLVRADGGKVKPARALVRFIGMNVAMIPLPWGFVPIPFGRRGFPDWLAHTSVIEAQQLSLAEARQQRMRAKPSAARDGQPSPAQNEAAGD
jgi:uncharacterized RDD family membrane protein YckC